MQGKEGQERQGPKCAGSDSTFSLSPADASSTECKKERLVLPGLRPPGRAAGEAEQKGPREAQRGSQHLTHNIN